MRCVLKAQNAKEFTARQEREEKVKKAEEVSRVLEDASKTTLIQFGFWFFDNLKFLHSRPSVRWLCLWLRR